MGVILTVFSFVRQRLSYGLYAASALLLPLCSGTLKSMGRFIIVLFPFYMVMAVWGEHKYVHLAILVVSLIYLGSFVGLYTYGSYLG